MIRDDVIDPGKAIRAGITTDALILDAICIAMQIEDLLQNIGITWSRNAGGQAVAEGHEDRPFIFRGWLSCWFRGTGGGICTFFCVWRFLASAARD